MGLKSLMILMLAIAVVSLTYAQEKFIPDPNWRTEYDEDRDDIELDCLTSSTSHIVWTRNNQPIDDRRVQIVNNNMTLRIFDPKTADTGWYMCSMWVDGVKTDSYAREITVSARPYTKPQVIDWDPESTKREVVIGASTNLSCTFDGGSMSNPVFQSDMIWMRNGTLLNDGTSKFIYDISGSDSSKQTTLFLTINNITQEDLGAYECVISNSLGNDTKSLSLQLTDWKDDGQTSIALWEYIVMGAGGFVFIAIVISISVFIRMKRKSELEWLKPDLEHFDVPDNDILYDVFISYSSDDEDWVKNELFFYLVEKGYRVNIDFKDFVPGMAIAENVMDSIYKSKKTIVVMSKNFLKSMWGQFELQQAHNRGIAKREDILILIKYGKCKVPGKLLGKTFLDWTDFDVKPHFWVRLTEAIGPPVDIAVKEENKGDDRAIIYEHGDEGDMQKVETKNETVSEEEIEEYKILENREIHRATSDYESDFTEAERSDEVFLESVSRSTDFNHGCRQNPLILSAPRSYRISTDSNSRESCDDETQHLL